MIFVREVGRKGHEEGETDEKRRVEREGGR